MLQDLFYICDFFSFNFYVADHFNIYVSSPSKGLTLHSMDEKGFTLIKILHLKQDNTALPLYLIWISLKEMVFYNFMNYETQSGWCLKPHTCFKQWQKSQRQLRGSGSFCLLAVIC